MDRVRNMISGSIEVEFGPHWADVVLVGVTLAAAVTSAAVAIAAHRSGKHAQSISEQSLHIAKDANRREKERLRAERLAVLDHERGETALAMIRALLAVKTYSLTPARVWALASEPSTNERHATARQDADLLEAEALARITLSTRDARLREWFSHMRDHVYAAFGHQEVDPEDADALLSRVLLAMGQWGAGELTLKELSALDEVGPLGIEQGDPKCSGDTF